MVPGAIVVTVRACLWGALCSPRPQTPLSAVGSPMGLRVTQNQAVRPEGPGRGHPSHSTQGPLTNSPETGSHLCEPSKEAHGEDTGRDADGGLGWEGLLWDLQAGEVGDSGAAGRQGRGHPQGHTCEKHGEGVHGPQRVWEAVSQMRMAPGAKRAPVGALWGEGLCPVQEEGP